MNHLNQQEAWQIWKQILCDHVLALLILGYSMDTLGILNISYEVK